MATNFVPRQLPFTAVAFGKAHQALEAEPPSPERDERIARLSDTWDTILDYFKGESA